MTEQERPRTEAGRELLRMGHTDVENIRAIEAEGRQQAVRDVAAQMRADGWEGRLIGHSVVCAILDRVAGLNANESPLTHNHPSVGFDEACPACQENLRVAASKWVGDASEAGQPPEASDE